MDEEFKAPRNNSPEEAANEDDQYLRRSKSYDFVPGSEEIKGDSLQNHVLNDKLFPFKQMHIVEETATEHDAPAEDEKSAEDDTAARSGVPAGVYEVDAEIKS